MRDRIAENPEDKSEDRIRSLLSRQFLQIGERVTLSWLLLCFYHAITNGDRAPRSSRV